MSKLNRSQSKFSSRRNQRGSAALIAIVTMLILVILGLCGATLAMNARLMSSHKAREVKIRAIAEAGVEYGYWQFIWNRNNLPFNETNRAFGEGSFSVRVVNNNSSVADSIQVTSTATLRGATYQSTRVFRSDQQSNRYSINPASTFLYFHEYGAVDAQRVKLSSLDIDEGDTIRLTVHGHWGPTDNPYYSSATNIVFSKSMNLKAPNNQKRVDDAVSSSTPSYVSGTKGGVNTDILEDFSITNTIDVVVPRDAKYLFMGVDYTQAVNISSDGYSLEIEKIADGS